MPDAPFHAHHYSGGQVEASRRVLVELTTLFHEYRDHIRLVGGWVPSMLFPGDHVGSIDIDLVLNHRLLGDVGYEGMAHILERHGYARRPDQYFTYTRCLNIDGITYDVDVDFLAGKYDGSSAAKRSQHVQGLKALKATGGQFAFDFAPCEVEVEAARPDGALDVVRVNVVAVLPFLVMKAAAMEGRNKSKDAYDTYYVVRNYPGGFRALAEEIRPHLTHSLVQDMLRIWGNKFRTPEHAGPTDVAAFEDIADEEDRAILLRDASERMMALTRLLIGE